MDEEKKPSVCNLALKNHLQNSFCTFENLWAHLCLKEGIAKYQICIWYLGFIALGKCKKFMGSLKDNGIAKYEK